MNENTKTLVFVAVALAVGVLAYATRPGAPVVQEDQRGSLLFERINVEEVAEVQIYKHEEKNRDIIKRFTEGKYTPTSLIVKKVKDSWVVASNNDYPVDAEAKVGTAAATLLGLKIEGVASENRSDHEDYGVVQPDTERFDPQAKGVGTLVRLKDAAGNDLVDIVIGDEVMKIGDAVSGQRYVRRANQDRVYLVSIDPAELSTKFQDWIKDDLLKLSTDELRRLVLKDYAIVDDELGRPGIYPRSNSNLSKSDENWQVDEMKQLDEKAGAIVDRKLAKDEELDTGKVDQLGRALAGLKIVNVAPKPEALATALRKGQLFARDRDSVTALRSRGFHPNPTGDDTIEIISDQGEVIAGLNTGVEYVLRFGGIAGRGDEEPAEENTDSSEKKDGAEKDGDDKQETKKQAGLNRFIYVSTRFNQDLIPAPNLEPEPKLEDYLPKDNKSVEPKDGTEKKSEEKEQEAVEESKDATDEAEEEATEPDEKQPAAEEKAQPAEDAEPKDTAPDADKPAEPKQKTPAELAQEQFEKELARVKRENEKKRNEYDLKLLKGRETVEQLNAQFADWFYVISESEYKKIHLTADDLIKKKGAKPEGGANGLPPGHPPLDGGFQIPGAGLRDLPGE